MMFLETDLAIFRRLVGYPLDNKGRPVLDPITRRPTNALMPSPPFLDGQYQPSWGIQVPALKHPHDTFHGQTSNDPNSLNLFAGFDANAVRQVPIFDENIESRKWVDIWPCVTFKLQNFEFNPKVYHYNDPIVKFDTTSAPVNITNNANTVVKTGYEDIKVRSHPEAFDLTYSIRVYSKNRIEYMCLLSQILSVFPARTALKIEAMDGETYWLDMNLAWSQNLDLRGEDIKKSLDPSEQAHYSTAFFYKVEAYMDNSRNAYGMHEVYTLPAINQRFMEIISIRDRELIDGGMGVDLNEYELEPLA